MILDITYFTILSTFFKSHFIWTIRHNDKLVIKNEGKNHGGERKMIFEVFIMPIVPSGEGGPGWLH